MSTSGLYGLVFHLPHAVKADVRMDMFNRFADTLRQKGFRGIFNIDVMACCAGAVRTPGYINAQTTKEAPGILDASIVTRKALEFKIGFPL